MSHDLRGGQVARPFSLAPPRIVTRVPGGPAVVLPPGAPLLAPAPAPKAAATPFPGGIGKGGPWKMNPYWLGETVFVVASGPSIKTVNFDLIRGRKIICVNSSYEVVPFASLVYFGDGRWWAEHKKALASWPGHIVTCSGLVKDPRVLRINRLKPESVKTGFNPGRDGVASQRTSLQGAMNIAAHLTTDGKVKGKIVLIGADMGRDPKTGVSHGHTPHKWPSRPGNVTWDEQMRHLKWIVPHLKERGIEVVNTSMGSRIPWWPKMTLEDFIQRESGE